MKKKEKTEREINQKYQDCREELNWSREKAAMELDFITESRLERIEYGAKPQPEEVIKMSTVYKKPELINYYCRNNCAIGKEYFEDVKPASLSSIVLSVLSSLSSLDKDKERLIEIASDDTISADEKVEFDKIKKKLEEMSNIVESLKLWVNQKNI